LTQRPASTSPVERRATGVVLEAAVFRIHFPFVRGKVSYSLRMSKLFTTESAAAYLGVTPARVRQLILEERLPSEKYGRDHLISEDALEQYEKNGRKKVGRPPKKRLARALG
jgi:excisionase family DNA binding protein